MEIQKILAPVDFSERSTLGYILIESARAWANELLQKVGCKTEVHIDAAEPAKYVPFAVRDAGAGLLVVGRSAPNGLNGRLRTNAYALIRESPCPVISV